MQCNWFHIVSYEDLFLGWEELFQFLDVFRSGPTILWEFDLEVKYETPLLERVAIDGHPLPNHAFDVAVLDDFTCNA